MRIKTKNKDFIGNRGEWWHTYRGYNLWSCLL